MKTIMYIVGFIFAALIVYLIGAAGAWSWNPADWGGFWRVWVLGWMLFWGHMEGLYYQERVMFRNTSRVIEIRK